VIGSIGLGLAGGLAGGDSAAGDVSEALRAVFRAADTDGNGRLDEAEFRALLEGMDKHLRSVPATAQVAKQQGRYLADVANRAPDGLFGSVDAAPPFAWTDLGSMAFLGGDEAAAKLPGVGVLKGVAAGALWRGFETVNQQSLRSRSAVAFDQLKVRLFGRDTSTLRR
jgi:NADH:ubiquinone reductase (non-electrogenic)